MHCSLEAHIDCYVHQGWHSGGRSENSWYSHPVSRRRHKKTDFLLLVLPVNPNGIGHKHRVAIVCSRYLPEARNSQWCLLGCSNDDLHALVTDHGNVHSLYHI